VTLAELRGLLGARLADPIALSCVLEEVMSASRSQLIVEGGREVTDDEFRRAVGLVDEVVAGVPLQYVIGHWTFRTLELAVDRRALIPRPETEMVVSVALDELARLAGFRPLPLRCLDLGTGTGAIALSLLSEFPDVSVVATDASREALELADENRAQLAEPLRDRLELRHGGWYGALAATGGGASPVAPFDLICANPPYLSDAEWREVDPVVRDYDPVAALVAGPVGTEQIEQILAGAGKHLAGGGSLVVEIGWKQGPEVMRLATSAGAGQVSVLPDLAGRDRILLARF
jgi:release factor glutamine methyltransferase